MLLPVNAGALFVPVAVVLCWCVPSALPVNVGALFVPAAVTLCWCVPSALPVNVCDAGPVTFAVPPDVVLSAAVVCALTVPAGVPALIA